MPWSYNQRTGQLSRDGALYGRGYSGHGTGRDNPAMERTPNTGPIPVGTYTIGAPFTHPHSGSNTMRLTPAEGTNTHGRNGLMIHGDSIARPGTASQGCVILNRHLRDQIWSSGDHTLEVTR
ncbi:tlde1 domain-containing protein [Paraburkholderia acidisoli]|uniref:DUF2778 domain-containing protein n=1 Tax=Paraburkholderia acidisoli TaxID=2571748 RepID=A0A7Z2GHR7_9BURK|nr:tlde1 domain-containing protein [Paraburkholderia acidisoli]QGZ61645.1 DUF2778 domain-containing protein [Paraburkholderia acidisoli]